jgi:hypothetical protein
MKIGGTPQAGFPPKKNEASCSWVSTCPSPAPIHAIRAHRAADREPAWPVALDGDVVVELGKHVLTMRETIRDNLAQPESVR